jgi:signal transduction histidine kinase
MARLIEDVLDLCRGTRGTLAFRARPVDLATVVAAAVRSVRPQIAARRHRLTVSLPPNSTVLEADAGRLEQVLSNLLANAAKFTEPGGHVDLIAAPTPTGLVIRVRDDGVGIEPEALPHVFDLYHQGRAGRERGGLGIGLALVRSLVELHGGSVTAQSDGPGTGAQFTVFLPMRRNRPEE